MLEPDPAIRPVRTRGPPPAPRGHRGADRWSGRLAILFAPSGISCGSRCEYLTVIIRRQDGLPHPPGRGTVTSRDAARWDSAAAMSEGIGTFEPWKP